MKKVIILLPLVLIFFSAHYIGAQEMPITGEKFAEIKSQVILPFLEALKNGDTKAFKQLMTKDMYETRKVLLEQNATYPAFLRKLYGDATFQVGNAMQQNGEIVVPVAITFPDGRRRNIHLRIKEDGDNYKGDIPKKSWKISGKVR